MVRILTTDDECKIELCTGTQVPVSDKANQARALFGQGLTLQQIADEVGLTLSQVEDILYRATVDALSRRRV